MANYTVLRTDTADALIHGIILNIAEKFGAEVALKNLDELEKQIMILGDNPYIGIEPRYMILRRQGYKVFITERNMLFYKINDEEKLVVVYAVVDQIQDYLSIVRGL